MTLADPFKERLNLQLDNTQSNTLVDPFKEVALTNPYQETGKQKQPGFVESLKNPIDLWKYDSIPMSLYYWMSGNTKQKQAKENYYNNIIVKEKYNKYHI